VLFGRSLFGERLGGGDDWIQQHLGQLSRVAAYDEPFGYGGTLRSHLLDVMAREPPNASHQVLDHGHFIVGGRGT